MVQLAAKLAKSIAQKIADNKKMAINPPRPMKPFQGKGHRLDDDDSAKVVKHITKQSKKVKSTARTKGTVPTLVA